MRVVLPLNLPPFSNDNQAVRAVWLPSALVTCLGNVSDFILPTLLQRGEGRATSPLALWERGCGGEVSGAKLPQQGPS